MSALREAVDGLVAVATEAGLAPDRARDEGMVFAAAIAEAAPRAALDWCAALEAGPTDLAAANAAFFDAANGYAGCIAGLHEVLRRQGLLAGTWCLAPTETLSRGQRAEIDRVCRAYPHLSDDEFVAAHRDEWLR